VNPAIAGEPRRPRPASDIESKERLHRELSPGQLAMIAIGGAIGTGLFLGSSLAVRTAGPGVIFTYVIGAVIALLLMRALSEMAAAHPTAGSFGVHAEIYLSRWAGFTMRYTYWAAQSIANGSECVAAAIYCQWWFPQTPRWAWILGFSVALVYVNARSVGNFGRFEYWFSTIKVTAIVLFIVFGAALITGIGGKPAIGFANYTAYGGFLPHGLAGVWMATVFVIFGYLGTEIVAVTAGEARNPEVAVPRAMRSMVMRLIIFYIGAIAMLVGIVPWNRIQPGSDVTASPFVKVFQLIGVPAAAHVVNFVVITAVVSSLNCNLYIVTRMLFSLARGGYAPALFGRVSARGTPIAALLASTGGLALAVLVAALYPDGAYVYLFGISLFGGLYVWLAIFVTHLLFRRSRGGAFPWLSVVGGMLIAAVLATTWFVEGMRVTLIAGLPWLGALSVAYYWMHARES
jgi:amino acid transporter, AAT family